MPNVSALLSGGVSVGILAGVVSGLFYLVVAGMRWAGKLRADLQKEEARQTSPQDTCCECRRQLPSLPTKRVLCGQCGGRACRTCSVAAPQEGQGLCSTCHKQREVKLQSGEWFFKQVHRRFNTAALTNTNHRSDDGVGMDPECVQVREFIERLVESLVSGGLDDVCVKRLHSHPEYDRMFACHHASLCETLARLAFTLQMAIANKPMPEQETPSAAHSALKQLIHQIIQEAMTLPTLQDFENRSMNKRASQEHSVSAEDMTSKTYEDILATAILNKVIERYQQTGGLGSTPLDGNSNMLKSSIMEQQPKFISRLEIGVKTPDSLEEENASSINFLEDCNMTETSITDPLSFTIEECIEEVTTYSESEEEEEEEGEEEEEEEEEAVALEPAQNSGLNFYRSSLDFIKGHRVPFPELGMDIVDGSPLTLSDQEKEEEPYLDECSSPQPTDLISPVDSWEENWLFQRRRLKSSGAPQPMPVPMLVPNPSEEYRALIGDRDVEEYSDLSDCSDSVLEDVVLAEAEKDNTRHMDQPSIVQEEVKSARDLENSFQPVRAVPCITIDTLDEETEENSDQDKCNEEIQNNVEDCEINFKVQEMEHADQIEEYSSIDEGLDLAEAKNVELYKSSLDCLSEFGQQDSEYTEDYATVTQRQMDSLSGLSESELPTSPSSRPSSLAVSSDYSVHLASSEQSPNQSIAGQQLDSDQSQAIPELTMPPRPGIDQSDDENCTLPRTGTIAEREHKKWESAPPLPNNPYSSENISKRLNKNIHYNRHSSSDTSVEFPELKNESIIGNVIEKPLQIVCAPDDLDYKRYGRDYYINSKASSGERNASSSSVVAALPNSITQQPQDNCNSDCEINPLRAEPEIRSRRNVDEEDNENIKTQIPHLVESEVARWQREINQTEQQWIQKFQPNKSDIQKINTDSQSQNDTLNIIKSTISNGRNEEKSRSPVLMKQKNIDKRQQVPQDDPKSDLIYGKSSFKQIKFPIYQEQIKSSEVKISARNGDGTYIINKDKPKLLLDESSIEFLNGSGRSDSPSEASIVSSDSDLSHNMPSVKELTKHFASIADSDSSSSTPKSPSPAPKWRPPEQQPVREKVTVTARRPTLRPSLSPSRPVREVHSLTARSISREFREGLRRHQPFPLDRNVYNQPGGDTSHVRLSSNGTSAEGYSTHSSTSDEMETSPSMLTSEVPLRSLSHNIAFWEQLQNNKP